MNPSYADALFAFICCTTLLSTVFPGSFTAQPLLKKKKKYTLRHQTT